MINKRRGVRKRRNMDYSTFRFAPRWRGERAPPGDPGQSILFHFMCRWTCSRCWKTTLILNHFLGEIDDHHVAVVLVGSGHHLQPAIRLAAELKLPFTLLADDHGALRRAYGLPDQTPCGQGQAVVLVDPCGDVRFRWTFTANFATFSKKALSAILAHLGSDRVKEAKQKINHPVWQPCCL